MQLHTIKLENPDGLNLIMGQSHFKKTVEDIYNALIGAIPEIQFGLAFTNEAGPTSTFVKQRGTSNVLADLAERNASKIGVSDTFVLFSENAFPVNVMKALKRLPEISEIYCATSNPIEVIVVETQDGRGVMGLVGDYTDPHKQSMA
ncbi:hypothetical protein GWN42_31130 [candidate division KSB1 bacterium]|nr:hypothetical protein [candidate division KSB1 bacterium]